MEHRRWQPSYVRRGPSALQVILVANCAVFVLATLAFLFNAEFLVEPLELTPSWVVRGAVWQLLTYAFVHAGFWHLVFNMLTLWFLGRDLEATWGRTRFTQFYLVCCVGAGLVILAAHALLGGMGVSTVGASGGVYGVLLAFGMLYPDRELLFLFFPLKAKYMVMILGAFAFLMSLQGGVGTGVSHVGHLGGMLVAYLWLLRGRKRRGAGNPLAWAQERYRQWKVERARRRFQVYLRKQDRDRVH